MKQSDLRTAAIVILGLLAAPAAGYAAGSSSSEPAAQPDLYKQAKELVDDQQYAQAIPLLQKSIQQKGEYADALNLLGFSNRKLGDMSKAMTYYTKALNKEPKHLGANEYMGELYLEMNNLPKAEERLAVLKGACGNCEEFEDLDGQIKDYKKAHGLS
ncbi:MAG TPA: tetratricopeptide repeat protein [Dongiaceae bacterium]|jgi:tetratricopeptide (TPR) repeat protein|nr:tetratricopeptide repeat protein [Dongiaceae bacterium]